MSTELDARPPAPHPAWESFSVGEERFRLRRVAAGTYTTGSTDADEWARDNEKPRHSVRFSRSYGVGEFAVTQGLYDAVMGDKPSELGGQSDSARRPVHTLSWFEAVDFCNRLSERCGLPPAYRIEAIWTRWRGKDVKTSNQHVSCDFSAAGFRLPTEHEWEVAARAGTDFAYAGGDDLDSVGWFEDNSTSASHPAGQTHPVGHKTPNSWGLYDLSGNVWEWCWDSTDRDWTLEAYRPGTITDPTGHEAGPAPSERARVARGGGWYGMDSFARVAHRQHFDPSDGNPNLGFRLTRTLP